MSSEVLTVPVNSTVPLERPLNRLCLEVGRTSSLPKETFSNVTSCQYSWVGGSERYKEIHRNLKQTTVWNCLVPIERILYLGTTKLVKDQRTRQGPRDGPTCSNVVPETRTPLSSRSPMVVSSKRSSGVDCQSLEDAHTEKTTYEWTSGGDGHT